MVSSVTASTLESLPLEILEGILSALCRADLAKCVRVCRSWNYLLIPYLWHTIAIRSPSQVKKFLTRDVQLALLNNAEFVRVLHLNHVDLYERLLSSHDVFCWNIGISTTSTPDGVGATFIFSNLHSLELHPPRHLLRGHSRNIAALVRQNPGIQHLVINVAMENITLLDLLSNHLPNLQHFEVTMLHRNLEAMLRRLPESLRTFKLHDIDRNDAWYRYENGNIEAASIVKTAGLSEIQPHHALETLHIDGTFRSLGILRRYDCLIPFLKSCSPRLKNISGWDDAFYHNKELVKTLLEIGLQWKVLSQDNMGHVLRDAQLAEVISGSSDWTHIALRTFEFGPLTATAVVDHCENLEVLHIMRSGHTELRGSQLQAILSKARRLRSLKVPFSFQQNMITAADILSSEWATTSLECIDFKIGVPRCRDTTDQEAIQACHDIQRKVLRRLGQQKHLRELRIGGWAKAPMCSGYYPYKDCLEMTLQSGLDELAGLKELEVIDIDAMDHSVGVPELEWMDRNLPKLRSIVGLRNPGILHIYRGLLQEAVQWQQTHRPDWSVPRD